MSNSLCSVSMITKTSIPNNAPILKHKPICSHNNLTCKSVSKHPGSSKYFTSFLVTCEFSKENIPPAIA